MQFIKRLFARIGGYARTHNFTCDICGREVFADERICADCMKALPVIALRCPVCGRRVREEGVCSALREQGRDQTLIMVASDLMGKNYERLREGVINLLIGQEAQEQGYEPVMILYRLLFNGEKPAREYLYTDIVIKTKYNI